MCMCKHVYVCVCCVRVKEEIEAKTERKDLEVRIQHYGDKSGRMACHITFKLPSCLHLFLSHYLTYHYHKSRNQCWQSCISCKSA
jgi:hypothetical protein